MRRLWPGRRRCPLGRWLLRASRVADTARRLMWSENALKMPRYSVSLCTCVCVCTVGIWSYVLGNIHFWTCPILWDPFHEHSECPQIWPETGETYQRHLLWQHVTQKGFEIGFYPSNRSSYDVMTVCWSEISGDRPNFESLVHTFDDILERESGYIDLCSWTVKHCYILWSELQLLSNCNTF